MTVVIRGMTVKPLTSRREFETTRILDTWLNRSKARAKLDSSAITVSSEESHGTIVISTSTIAI